MKTRLHCLQRADKKAYAGRSSYRRSAAHASNTSGASTGSGGGPTHTSTPLGRLLTHTLARLRSQILDLAGGDTARHCFDRLLV